MIAFEALKLRRSRRPWIALSTLGVFLTLMLLGFWLYAKSRQGPDVQFRYTFENRSYFNGITFTVYAFYFGCMLLLPIFLAIEGGTQLAGETSTGRLRLLLTRPVSRSRVLLAKFGVASLYAALLVGGFLAVTLAVGLFAVGWGDLRLYPGVLQMTATPQFLEQREALLRFTLIWPAVSLAMLVPIAFSFCLSAWMRNAVNAASTAVSLFLVLHVISGVPFFEDLRPYLFTTDLGYWRALLQETIDWNRVSRDAAKLATHGFVFLAVAHLRFRLREEA